MPFVHLHTHSQYSILNALASISDLVKMAKERSMSAVALTDQGNLFGAVEFYKECQKQGVKPIIGCELNVAPFSRFDKKKVYGTPFAYQLLFLAKNEQGYRNLCKLSSLAHLEGMYYTPRIDRELIEKHHEGLICLTGGLKGLIPSLIMEDKKEELEQEIAWMHALFQDDLYLEIQRHKMSPEALAQSGIEGEAWLLQSYHDTVSRQERVFDALKKLSEEKGIALVATNDVRYLHPNDWKAHEILMNVQTGETVEVWEKDSFGNLKERTLNPKRKAAPTHELYFKSEEEMAALFSDVPLAIDCTLAIAHKCTLELDFDTKYYPVYIPPHLEGRKMSEKERQQEAAAYLKKLCFEGIAKRYTKERLSKVQEKYSTQDPMHVVHDRLERELEIITSKGMCDYLLIVYDFIAWAKRSGIPMGPGRGSGAGSIILYLIGVTDIEPLRFNLFFERFINPERLSYPDIDVDICMDRRQEVIDYTVQKYGKEKVAQIITFGTMKAKMAIKDVGRVLSVPLAKVNALSKLVPEDPTMTLERALQLDPELKQHYDQDPEVHRLIDLAALLEGCVRNTGVHAAGLIVSGVPIMEHIPVCVAKDSDLILTQYAMKPVESVGMLKIDFLGLKTLTSIQRTVDAIKVNHGKEIDWVNLSLDDSNAFALLNQGKTQGIFQVESSGMQELLKKLRIDCFEEIIAVGALYRPGPMEMIPSFISRKHGHEEIEIDHPLMEDILAETYGIMVYQEQVMQIASRLAGYSLGEGDVLRRAMGKKDKAEMARQRTKFRQGALERGMDEAASMRIYDKIEKFASYGFNKSHAAAYGYLTYVTAFLKANYPMEWMAALMTSDVEDTAKVAKVIRECRSMHIAILPPDVNESGKEFVATRSGIRFALSAIKGVGEGVVGAIMEERKKGGAFGSLYDFLLRIDTHKVGKKVVELLIFAGAFDFTGWRRDELCASIEPMYAEASLLQKERSQGVLNFFSLLEESQESRFAKPPKVETPLSKSEVLSKECALLGFYLTGHPMDDYRKHMQRLSSVPLSHFEELQEGTVVRATGILEAVQVRIAQKSQRKFAIVTLSDGMERYEVPIWSDLYEERSELIVEGQLVYTVLEVERQEGALKLQCRALFDLTRLDEAMIEACDAVVERSRARSKMEERREKKMRKKKGEQEVEKILDELTLNLNADALRLSKVLALKKIFRSFPGESAVTLQFCARGEVVGSVAISAPWGVRICQELQQRIKDLGICQ